MKEYEKTIHSQEEKKNRIRERYKGVSRDELEFIPAKSKEKLFEDTGTKQVNTVTKTLYPEKWKNSFGNRTDEITVFQRIHCYGNWDVLRPAQVIEGMDLISEEILKKLNDEAQNLIEKMRCAV